MGKGVIKISPCRGTWLVMSVEHVTLGLAVLSSSPSLGGDDLNKIKLT